MRVIFAGTPDFARVAFDQIMRAGHTVLAVMTQPDRHAGRGMKLSPSPVKQLALEYDIEVLQPLSLRLDGKYPDQAQAAQQRLLDLQPDVIIVAAYGLILPQWVLDLPRYGCLNIHASLLPRWRGAAPIQRAIEAGDAVSGVTIMQMDAGLDTGAMLLQQQCPITVTTTAASLHDELADLGGDAILQVLSQIESGNPPAPVVQPDAGVTYAEKLQKAESILDLNHTAVLLDQRIRAFNPFPGAVLSLPEIDKPVKIWRAQAISADTSRYQVGAVVQIDKSGIDMATADGILRILELQKPGGKRQDIASFIQSWRYRP